jgi:hypothetical protein
MRRELDRMDSKLRGADPIGDRGPRGVAGDDPRGQPRGEPSALSCPP